MQGVAGEPQQTSGIQKPDRVLDFFVRRDGVVDGVSRFDESGEVTSTGPINGSKKPGVTSSCSHSAIIPCPLKATHREVERLPPAHLR
jgi:hypothetical protein